MKKRENQKIFSTFLNILYICTYIDPPPHFPPLKRPSLPLHKLPVYPTLYQAFKRLLRGIKSDPNRAKCKSICLSAPRLIKTSSRSALCAAPGFCLPLIWYRRNEEGTKKPSGGPAQLEDGNRMPGERVYYIRTLGRRN